MRVLFVENADSGKPEGGVNDGLLVHDLIIPHATDIYVTLFIVEARSGQHQITQRL